MLPLLKGPRTALLFALPGLLLAGASGCSGSSSAETDAGPGPLPTDASRADAPPAIDAAPPADGAPGYSCLNPIELTPGEGHEGDTSNLRSLYSASCSPGTSAAREAIHAIDVGPGPVDLLTEVKVDEEAEPPFDAVLYARETCGISSSEIGCVNFGWGDRLELLAVEGVVFFFVDGTHQFGGVREGPYQLETASRNIVAGDEACDPEGLASRCEAGLRCVGGTCAEDSPALACSLAPDLTEELEAGPVSIDGRTFLYAADHHQGTCAFDPEASFAEDIYRIDVTELSDLEASTDFPETEFDTYLYLRRGSCDGIEVACDDDVDLERVNLKTRLSAPALEPDSYYLFVDGSAAPGTGRYRLSVTLTPAD